MTSSIHIEVKGIKELQAALKRFPLMVKQYMEDAGREAAEDLLDNKGLRDYPGETSANKPPAPYYVRGEGMVYKSGPRGGSENLGTQWDVDAQGFKTTVKNNASYAKWVHGDKSQARVMAAIGWRKLFETAKERAGSMSVIYNRWVNKLLRDIKLK
jgi:hypothetical protein